jgi:[ribosomal protein S5]-alanine N-acetyltransferase
VEWFAAADAYLAVELREDGRFVGFVCLDGQDADPSRCLNLGYVFAASEHRKGYASEACRAVIRRAFMELEADRVVSGTAEANLPSRRLLDALGFREVGRSAASFTKDADGNPIELVGIEYSLSKAEWSAREAG